MQDSFEMLPTAPIPAANAQLSDPTSPRPRRNRAGILVGIAAIVIIAAAFSGLLFARSHNGTVAPQPDAILNAAAAAHLRDTQFSITLTLNTSSSDPSQGSSSSFAFTVKGNAALTTSPFRMDMKLNGSSIAGTTSNLTIEEIITSDALYIKEPPLPGEKPSKKPWQKLPLSSSTSSAGSTDFLDYHQLRHARLIGEEFINGRKTWHLRATLTDQLTGSSAATATAVAKQLHTGSVTGNEDLWILEDSKFPAKISLQVGITEQNPASFTGSSNSSGTLTVTMTETMVFTTWNTGLTIKLPPASQVNASPFPSVPPSTGQLLLAQGF